MNPNDDQLSKIIKSATGQAYGRFKNSYSHWNVDIDYGDLFGRIAEAALDARQRYYSQGHGVLREDVSPFTYIDGAIKRCLLDHLAYLRRRINERYAADITCRLYGRGQDMDA